MLIIWISNVFFCLWSFKIQIWVFFNSSSFNFARTLAVKSCLVYARGFGYMWIIQALFDLFLLCLFFFFLSQNDSRRAQWHVWAVFCIGDLQVMPVTSSVLLMHGLRVWWERSVVCCILLMSDERWLVINKTVVLFLNGLLSEACNIFCASLEKWGCRPSQAVLKECCFCLYERCCLSSWGFINIIIYGPSGKVLYWFI